MPWQRLLAAEARAAGPTSAGPAVVLSITPFLHLCTK